MPNPAPRVLLATAADVPDLDDEGRLLLDALRDRGLDADPAVWDDAAVDWAAARLVVVRSTWDYAPRRAEFLAWAERVAAVTELHNPVPVLAWSTDKRYLAELADAGLPVVPTAFLDLADGDAHPYLDVEHVVKPAVSAGSKDTLRLGPADADRSRAHVRAVHASGRAAIVQPYLASVDEVGETALLACEGRFTHAVRKSALLAPGGGLVEGLFAVEDIAARTPDPAELAVAEGVLAHVAGRFGAAPLYARVDLLRRDDGTPAVLEVELAEPSLFLDTDPAALATFADAVARRALT